MVLTNREKQARHRERLRDRSTALNRVLVNTRRRLREQHSWIARFDEGLLRMTRDGVDCTAEQVAMVRGWIAESIALLQEQDPDGLTRDGNIEIGDISPARSQELYRDKPVSYAIDAEGRAVRLKLFESDSAAQAEAGMTEGRFAGRIGEEGWSILPSMRARPLKDFSGWYVLIEWPTGDHEQVYDFGNEAEATAWITDKSATWLAARSR
jgi:hypothetical protein